MKSLRFRKIFNLPQTFFITRIFTMTFNPNLIFILLSFNVCFQSLRHVLGQLLKYFIFKTIDSIQFEIYTGGSFFVSVRFSATNAKLSQIETIFPTFGLIVFIQEIFSSIHTSLISFNVIFITWFSLIFF